MKKLLTRQCKIVLTKRCKKLLTEQCQGLLTIPCKIFLDIRTEKPGMQTLVPGGYREISYSIEFHPLSS